MNYGHLEMRIEELLKEKGISKNTICRDLDIPRANFNRYLNYAVIWTVRLEN